MDLTCFKDGKSELVRCLEVGAVPRRAELDFLKIFLGSQYLTGRNLRNAKAVVCSI